MLNEFLFAQTAVQIMWLYVRLRIEDNWLKQRCVFGCDFAQNALSRSTSELEDADNKYLYEKHDHRVTRRRREHNNVFGAERQQVPPSDGTFKLAHDDRVSDVAFPLRNR